MQLLLARSRVRNSTNNICDIVTEMDYPGERMIRRLFETLAGNGVASLLQPWHLRREVPSKEVLQQLDALSLSWRDISLDARKRIPVDSSSTGDAESSLVVFGYTVHFESRQELKMADLAQIEQEARKLLN